MLKRMLVVAPAAALALACVGCAKQTPSTVEDFSAASKHVVTLRDGETLTGRIAEGEDVTFVTFGRVYRARVEDVGANDIILSGAYVQEEYDRFEVQRDRMEDTELYLRDGTTRIRIPTYKIVDVQEINFDIRRTARSSLFWGFTTFVLSQILSARL